MHTFAWPFHMTRLAIQPMFLLDDAIQRQKKRISHNKSARNIWQHSGSNTPKKNAGEFIWPRHFIIKTTGRKCIAISKVQKGPPNLNRSDYMWICMFNEINEWMNERANNTVAMYSCRLGLVVDSSGDGGRGRGNNGNGSNFCHSTAFIVINVGDCLCMCLLGNFINFSLLSPKSILRTTCTFYVMFIYFVLTAAALYSMQSASKPTSQSASLHTIKGIPHCECWCLNCNLDASNIMSAFSVVNKHGPSKALSFVNNV